MAEDLQRQHAAKIAAEREVMKNLGVSRSQARDVLHGFATMTADRKTRETAVEFNKPVRQENPIQITEQKIGDAKGAAAEATTKSNGAVLSGSLHQFIFNDNGIDEYWTIPATFDGTV